MVAALLVLLAVVAAAAGPGPTPAGGRSPVVGVPRPVLDVVAAAATAACVLAIWELLSGLLQRPERVGRGSSRSPMHLPALALGAALSLGAFALFVVLARRRHRPPASALGAPLPVVPSGLSHLHQPAGPGWPAFVAGVAVAVLFLVWRTWRPKTGWRPSSAVGPVPVAEGGEGERPEVGPALEVLELSLAALAAEPDARSAVIRAYAHMEAWMAGAGLGRQPWEAAFEHLGRVLGGLGASAGTASDLARLFEQARFSPSPCGPEMKWQAISALTSLREQLTGVPKTSRPAGGQDLVGTGA